MGSEKRRKRTIQMMLGMIRAHDMTNEPITRKRITAEISVLEGVTPKKANEYVNVLIDAERIIETDEVLRLNGKQEL